MEALRQDSASTSRVVAVLKARPTLGCHEKTCSNEELLTQCTFQHSGSNSSYDQSFSSQPSLAQTKVNKCLTVPETEGNGNGSELML